MKMRVRDRQLPESAKTKKFRPLRYKNKILKYVLILSLAINLTLGYLCYKTF